MITSTGEGVRKGRHTYIAAYELVEPLNEENILMI